MKLTPNQKQLVKEYAKSLIKEAAGSKYKLTGVQDARTDGINSKKVKVKILEFAKHANYGEGIGDWNVYWVEYPKGNLNIAWTQSEGDPETEANILMTNPDVFWNDVLEMSGDKIIKQASFIAKKYNIKFNDEHIS